MTTIRITDIDGKRPSFTQWDVNRVIHVSGISEKPMLHFENRELTRSLVVEPEASGNEWASAVPNFLLLFPWPFQLTLFVQDTQTQSGEGVAVYRQTFNIVPRKKPQDFTYEENIGYINWVNKSEEVQALIDDITARLVRGDFKGDKGDPFTYDDFTPQQLADLKGEDGVSPEVTFTDITNGHRMTVTDKTHPTGQSIDILNGEDATNPVESVNGQTGEVTLGAEDVGALPSDADLDDIGDGSTYKRATAAQLAQIATNANDIDAIEQKIPSAASASNQLADKAYVADSIIQGTAIYRGAFASYAALMAVAWQTTDPDAANYVSNNDYTYVLDDETHDDECWRYLYVTGTGWTAQIRVNESPLTQAQLDALNSGATPAMVAGAVRADIVQNFDPTAQWRARRNIGAYQLPASGIPASDLASAVQTSLGNADTALQSVPDTYRTASSQDVIDAGKLGTSGDGSNVTVAFTAASSRTAIATGEKLSVLFGKVLKWFSDLGTAAFRAATSSISSSSTDLIESGAVFTALAGKLSTSTKYAASQSVAGPADKTVSIPMGAVDSTSTDTAFTATVSGITELRDGVLVWLTNGVVTSAAGCTLNINGLGAKPIYNSIAAATATTTTYNINYTMLFVFNSTRVTGGCWDMVYGYDSNTTYTPVKLGFGYATCSTAAATAAKTVSLSSYTLTANGLVAIKFSNDVPASATLNINSKGAKAIYYKDAAITAGVIKGGDTALFVYNAYYRLLAIDRWGTDITSILTALDNKQAKITASGILKGDGNGGVSAAVAGTDYQLPISVVTNANTTLTLSPCPVTYKWGEVATLTLTVTATSQYHFMFVCPSGAATVLTLTGITGTTGDTIEAGKTYEVDVWAGIALIRAVEITAVSV